MLDEVDHEIEKKVLNQVRWWSLRLSLIDDESDWT